MLMNDAFQDELFTLRNCPNQHMEQPVSPPGPGADLACPQAWHLQVSPLPPPMRMVQVLALLPQASSQGDDVSIGCFHGDSQRVSAFRVLSSQVSSPFQE